MHINLSSYRRTCHFIVTIYNLFYWPSDWKNTFSCAISISDWKNTFSCTISDWWLFGIHIDGS